MIPVLWHPLVLPSQQRQESQATVPTGPTGYEITWDNDISSLAKEFIEHVNAELRADFNCCPLEQWIWHCCASLERTTASEALQAVAASMAKDLVDRISGPLADEAEKARSALWRAGLPREKLQTRGDYEDYVGTFATANLKHFYPPGSSRASSRVSEIAKEMVARKTHLPNVPPELKPGMSKLALYDIVIYCGKLS